MDAIKEQNAEEIHPFDICKILGVGVSVSKLDDAAKHICESIDTLRGKYICFTNAHTIITAHDDPEYLTVQNSSALTFADGKSVMNTEKKRGYDYAERTAGPDFMKKVFEKTSDGTLSHYFFGSTNETLSELRRLLKLRYPNINIAGTFSPPYTPDGECSEAIELIKEANPDFIWIGLGAPKQEKWMYRHMNEFNGVMLGVGAGFDFHANTLKRAPVFMQKMGLEWLYRLMQEPKRLFKRYFVTNTKYMKLVGKENKLIKKAEKAKRKAEKQKNKGL